MLQLSGLCKGVGCLLGWPRLARNLLFLALAYYHPGMAAAEVLLCLDANFSTFQIRAKLCIISQHCQLPTFLLNCMPDPRMMLELGQAVGKT